MSDEFVSGAEGADAENEPTPSPPKKRNKRVSLIGTDFEQAARSEGYSLIAGLDEVGRGALAGPVVAAAVILHPETSLPAGLNDSKQLTPKERERIAEEIRRTAVAYAIGLISPAEIDQTNILIATRRAMIEALRHLAPAPDFLLIDALQLKEIELPQRAIIRGDCISASIAAASVVAKTYRDALMREYDTVHPQYGFGKHVGYGTRAHWEALRQCGPCEIHRKSFRGVLPNI